MTIDPVSPRQVTIREVARRAGVSMMTVSRVIHHPAKVAEQTRRRVLEAVEAIKYVPNLVGRSLVTNRTNLVAIVLPSIQNPVFADILRGMSDILRAEGYYLTLGTSSGSPQEEEKLITALFSQRPDGILIHGSIHTRKTRQRLQAAALPVVETGNITTRPIDLQVGYSNFEAARQATRHLVDRGYRNIGCIHPATTWNDRSADRCRGFIAALIEAGLPAGPEHLEETGYGLEHGAAALRRLLARQPNLDAVFCGGDIWAAGALFECQRMGLQVPGQLAIVGFDDLPIASQVVPPLTTVRVPRNEIGRQAAGLLLDRIGGKMLSCRKIDVGFELIVRASA
ncbi:LacI family DNA-binding transcriptional regulator [Shumkonia mesophila]|uniref:LacI family DNA-binding transcriptional regulator n=1 Tax=Shumkonia mesophila TaxID=2838854 RepID=UPI00293515AB|nr:LacI family DNA-binding transcriptional regulator [Shumkonia mesophila]